MTQPWKVVSSTTTCTVPEVGKALAELVQRVIDSLESPPEDLRLSHTVTDLLPGPYVLITLIVTYR